MWSWQFITIFPVEIINQILRKTAFFSHWGTSQDVPFQHTLHVWNGFHLANHNPRALLEFDAIIEVKTVMKDCVENKTIICFTEK